MIDNTIKIQQVSASLLKEADYNPRSLTAKQEKDLTESITKYGLVDPILVNAHEPRNNIIIGGAQRFKIAKKLGYTTLPVVYISLPLEKERELNLRLNKNTGEWNLELLAEFDESLLSEVGFDSEELDNIFDQDIIPEEFDLQKELAKLDIKEIQIKKGDVYQLGDSKMMCGDSTIESDMLKLMGSEKADLCLTDPPYILDYLHGKKRNGEATTGFGAKRNRRYLETDVIPPDFTANWMANISQIAKDDFHIICYENWKNLRIIWSEMERYWKVKNMIVWHLPNRTQGFAGKYKLFSKHDIAIVGGSQDKDNLNLKAEEELLQNEYEVALYAIQGKPHWESYGKSKKYCPTDFIEYKASDEKSSGQGVIFGTKPVEILIPYIKILTQRNDLVVEPFGGSGSTLIATTKMKRRCFLMEKSPVYAEVIKKRWEKLTGLKAKKLNE